MTLAGFDVAPFAHEAWTYPVYRGGDGPGVVVIHEVPGITPEVAGFGRRLIDAGYHVAMPSLFGTPGKKKSLFNVGGQIARACVRREFAVLAGGKSSPVTAYLRGLCLDVHRTQGGPGVGVIGMCLTGNFALALMADPVVMAPVLSQPSLPFGITRKQRAALHVGPAELEAAKSRSCGVLAMRFTHDALCPGARFETLRRELNAETIEIDSGPNNPHGIPRIAHSVVTNDLVDVEGHPTRAALDRLLGFFAERLVPDAR